jgi:hypothetical protein
MGFDPFKWRKRGIARLKDALEEQMPQYLERDERVVASMLGQTHPSAIGTELAAVGGPLYFRTGLQEAAFRSAVEIPACTSTACRSTD